MGGNHSHEGKASGEQGGSGVSTPRGSQRGAGSRSGSGGDLQGLADTQDKPPPSMVPVEKLGKLLAQKSQKEDGINGVTEKSFTKYLFPMYPELAHQFYKYVHRAARCKGAHIPPAAFRLHCERILSILDDHAIIDIYVKMFCSDTDENSMTPDSFRKLLYTSYKLSMDHYPEGPQTCLMMERTLSAVVSGCFGSRAVHSAGFVARWLADHCHRLLFPVHRYCVHVLATRHRSLAAAAAADEEAAGAGLDLATPVLERALGAGSALLPLSAAWLIAGAAPELYSRARAGAPPAAAPARAWLARLLCAVPSHWEPLYASRDHGRALNRFLHHTLAYRGPTVVVIEAEETVVAVCCPSEWRDTHQYWGSADCALLQLLPAFCVVERAPRMLYLNTAARGYPKGLRVGADPRSPTLDIPQDFDTVLYKGVSRQLTAIEVWGCGDPASRAAQLEVKKWQVKEAERQRCVKLSAADWIEHPDRYLLELAGRPQYNNSAS